MSDQLRATGIGKVFAKGPESIEVLKDLNLTVSSAETVAVVGASGVGKSTLLHVLGALDRPTAGSIEFGGQNLAMGSSKERARFRNESIGFVFQFHYLLPEFTALENAAMPLLMRGMGKLAAEAQAEKFLAAVGLSHRLDHRPTELSGGEQQRVAIARAMIGEPQMILADEPTGNLDLETGRVVMAVLFSVAREKQRSLIVATHNPELAARADRVLRLKDGRLIEEAKI